MPRWGSTRLHLSSPAVLLAGLSVCSRSGGGLRYVPPLYQWCWVLLVGEYKRHGLRITYNAVQWSIATTHQQLTYCESMANFKETDGRAHRCLHDTDKLRIEKYNPHSYHIGGVALITKLLVIWGRTRQHLSRSIFTPASKFPSRALAELQSSPCRRSRAPQIHFGKRFGEWVEFCLVYVNVFFPSLQCHFEPLNHHCVISPSHCTS